MAFRAVKSEILLILVVTNQEGGFMSCYTQYLHVYLS